MGRIGAVHEEEILGGDVWRTDSGLWEAESRRGRAVMDLGNGAGSTRAVT
jgi:hypothetical protein